MYIRFAVGRINRCQWKAQLIAFVRYKDTLEINEHILFCKKVTGRTTGEDVFNVIDNFFSVYKLD